MRFHWGRATRAALAVGLLTPMLHLAAAPATAAETPPPEPQAPTTITLRSGGDRPPGANDPLVELSKDGGTTWQPATVMNTHGAYALIPNTRWIGAEVNGNATGAGSRLDYRVSFTIPTAFESAAMSVQYHADNAATVFVNGNQVGAQPQAGVTANFQGTPDTVDNAVAAASLVQGANELRFVVKDFGLPTGLDFEATVTYTPDDSWSCSGASLPRGTGARFAETWYERFTTTEPPTTEDQPEVFDFDGFFSDAHQPVLQADGVAGFAERERQCLIVELDAYLAGHVIGYGDAGRDERLGLLDAIIFDHAWLDAARAQDESPLDLTGLLPDVPFADALAVIDGLVDQAVASAPEVPVPPSLLPAPLAPITLPAIPPAAGLPDTGLGIANLALTTTRQAVDSSTYQVCSANPVSPAPSCSPDIPLGSPWTADVNGDLVPDAIARLAPELPPLTGGALTSFRVAFTVDRMAGASGRLAGHVWAVFELPTAPVRINAGFVGLESTLADKSSMQIEIPNLTATINGDPKGILTVNHVNPGAVAGVSFGFAKLDQTQSMPKPIDPVTGVVTFSPLPAASLTVTAEVDRDFDNDSTINGESWDTRYLLGLSLPTPTRARVAITSSTTPAPAGNAPTAMREIVTNIDKVPASIDVRIDDLAPAGYLEADYLASSPITNGLDVTATSYADQNNRTNYTRFGAKLPGVPAHINAKFLQYATGATRTTQLVYNADSGVTGGVVAWLDAAADKVLNGTTIQQAAAHVEGVPSTLDVSVLTGQPGSGVVTHVPDPANDVTVIYHASATVPKVTARAFDSLNGSSATAELIGAPSEWTLHSHQPLAKPSANSVQFVANGRVVRLDVGLRTTVDHIGTLKLDGTLQGIPKQWRLDYGDDVPIEFTAGTPDSPETIDAVNLTLTNHDTLVAGARDKGHASVNMTQIDDNPATSAWEHDTIDASLAIGGVQGVRIETIEEPPRTDVTLRTRPPAVATVDMTGFRVNADVTSLDAATKAPTRLMVDGALRGIGGSALPPTLHVVKEGKEKAELTIEQDSSTPILAIAKIAVGPPSKVDEAIGLGVPFVSGVAMRDVEGGCPADSCDASRLNIYLDHLPSRIAVDTGAVSRDLSMPNLPDPVTPAFEIGGFTLPPGGRFDVDLELDDGDQPSSDLEGRVTLKGVTDGTSLRLYPIEKISNADPYIGLRYEADQPAGPLEIDLDLGAEGGPDPDSRIVVTVPSVPESVQFTARIPEAGSPAGETKFTGKFGHGPGLDNAGLPAVEIAMHAPSTARAQLALRLTDVPGDVTASIYSPGVAQPASPCQQVATPLPKVTYRAGGINRDDLDLVGHIQPDPQNQTTLLLDLEDVGGQWTSFESTPGGTFAVQSAPPAKRLQVNVLKLRLDAVDIDFDNCHAEFFDFGGHFKIGLETDLSLDITGATTVDGDGNRVIDTTKAGRVELVPGLVSGIKADGADGVSVALSNTSANLQLRDFGLRFNVPIGGGLTATGQLFGPVNRPTLDIPLAVEFHKADQSKGRLVTMPLGIPCPQAPLLTHIVIDGQPRPLPIAQGRQWGAATFTSDPLTKNGQWIAMADPYLVDAFGQGIKILPWLGIIDSADLLTVALSPYPAGLSGAGPWGLPVTCGLPGAV